MNKVILLGRLTKDPDIRQAANLTVAKFSLAVQRQSKNENGCDFINCTAFGKTAEFIEKYARKGTKFIIEGRWQTDSYTNKDGKKVYTNECIIESLEFAESKQQETNTTQQPPYPSTQPPYPPQQPPYPSTQPPYPPQQPPYPSTQSPYPPTQQ